MSYGNWKHILGVFSFQNSIFNGIFVIKPTYPAAMFDKWNFFFFGETQPQCLTNSLIFFFFFGETEPQLLKLKTGSELRCQIGGLGNWGILSDKWWVMKIEQWKLSDDKLQTKQTLIFYTPRVPKNFLSLCHVAVFYWVNKIRITNLRGT